MKQNWAIYTGNNIILYITEASLAFNESEIRFITQADSGYLFLPQSLWNDTAIYLWLIGSIPKISLDTIKSLSDASRESIFPKTTLDPFNKKSLNLRALEDEEGIRLMQSLRLQEIFDTEAEEKLERLRKKEEAATYRLIEEDW